MDAVGSSRISEPNDTLKPTETRPTHMQITVELVGEGSHEVELEEGTYGDLLAPFDVSEHEVSILVDGRPVPEDRPVDDGIEQVQILRLIQGG